MRNTIVLCIIAILFLAATAAFAAEIESINSATTTVSNAKPEGPQWVQYDATKHGTWQWQRGNNRNGYRGHWLKIPANYKGGVLVWPNGAMEMAKCGNELPSPPAPPRVIIKEVVREVPVVHTEIKWRTRTVTREVEVPGPTVVITPANAQPLWAVTNAPQPYSQTVTPGAPAMGGFVYAPSKTDIKLSSSACATGGSVGPIDINNANTNTLTDGTVINIGSGSANGQVNGTGNSTAGQPTTP